MKEQKKRKTRFKDVGETEIFIMVYTEPIDLSIRVPSIEEGKKLFGKIPPYTDGNNVEKDAKMAAYVKIVDDDETMSMSGYTKWSALDAISNAAEALGGTVTFRNRDFGSENSRPRFHKNAEDPKNRGGK